MTIVRKRRVEIAFSLVNMSAQTEHRHVGRIDADGGVVVGERAIKVIFQGIDGRTTHISSGVLRCQPDQFVEVGDRTIVIPLVDPIHCATLEKGISVTWIEPDGFIVVAERALVVVP